MDRTGVRSLVQLVVFLVIVGGAVEISKRWLASTARPEARAMTSTVLPVEIARARTSSYSPWVRARGVAGE